MCVRLRARQRFHAASRRRAWPRIPGPAITLPDGPGIPRWIGEYASSRILDTITPASEVGEGRPVLVLPGFAANDFLTGRLRAHLRQR